VTNKSEKLFTVHDHRHILDKTIDDLKCLGCSCASLVLRESIEPFQHSLNLNPSYGLLVHLFGCQSERGEKFNQYFHDYLCHSRCRRYLDIDFKPAKEDRDRFEQVHENIVVPTLVRTNLTDMNITKRLTYD
jgi:hypothetical protein